MARIRSSMVTPLLLISLLAQEGPTIRTNVPLVVVPVSVTDSKGRSLDGLEIADFIVTDNGKAREIQMDTADTAQVPISLVIAVQVADIAGPMLAKLRKTSGLIEPLIIGQRGEAALLTFDSEVKVAQDFTADAAAMAKAFLALKPGAPSSGRMIDAVEQGVQMLRERPGNRRKVLIVISESKDRGSKGKLWDVAAEAQRAGVLVYPATFSAYVTPFTTKPSDMPTPPQGTNLFAIFTELAHAGKTNAADAFAQSTGGHHVAFATLKTLERELSGIGEELHSQYILSFTPAGGEAGFRRIEVRVKDHPEAVIRSRPGYWVEASVAQ